MPHAVSPRPTARNLEQGGVSAGLAEPIESHPHVPTVSRTVVLFPLEAVAEYLAVSLAVVEQLVADRAFPVLRIGAERRIRLEDLQAYLRRVEE